MPKRIEKKFYRTSTTGKKSVLERRCTMSENLYKDLYEVQVKIAQLDQQKEELVKNANQIIAKINTTKEDDKVSKK